MIDQEKLSRARKEFVIEVYGGRHVSKQTIKLIEAGLLAALKVMEDMFRFAIRTSVGGNIKSMLIHKFIIGRPQGSGRNRKGGAEHE